MPLRDHFRSPLTTRASWEEVHGGWPMVIVQQLGRILPERYVAAPRIHLGSQWEIDIATLDRDVGGPAPRADRDDGSVTAWSPSAPSMTIETALADLDEYEVRVYDARYGRRLVAAIELVSPANKDRPESRAQFVEKCAALLRKHVSVVVVDVVSIHNFNLFTELLDLVDAENANHRGDFSPMYAASCRWRAKGLSPVLEVWNRPLELGQPLPLLPLWLTEDFAVPLDLEASYEQTCADLRIG